MQKCKVYVYMIEGFNFAKRDLFSASDPYLVMKCGKTEFNEREHYILDSEAPTFHKSFVFQMDFPGSPALIIQAYDYDDFFGDDLIGTTQVHLDDRYYS